MSFFNNKTKLLIHFIGIGGIGMSGIAELMLDQGYSIQGSDISLNDNIKRLKKRGVKFFLGHKKTNLRNVSAVIYSSAINKKNVEIVWCKKLSIPLLSRAEMLADIMREKNSIAIAGSHGKTTTTSLVGTILENSGLDPTIINGGIINAYSKNNRFGKSKWMVVEADESDGSFLKLFHQINIITNIDSEHLDYYKSDKEIVRAFNNFITNIPFYGFSIICLDNKYTKKISKKIKTRNIITYSIKSKNVDIKIKNIKQIKYKTHFSIFIKKNIIPKYSGIYKFKNNLLGNHNVLNATGAIVAAMLIGLPIYKIQKALNNFKGVKRRFTFLGRVGKSLIYDDYAHHPTEIMASYEIARSIAKKKIVVIFQPHRYTRTKFLYSNFIKVLRKIDVIFILDIYSAGEKPIKNISSFKLVKDIKKFNSNAYYLDKNTSINKSLAKYYKKENIIIFMGAGSITNEAKKLISETNV